MIENSALNRDLLKLNFLKRVEPISKSKLSLENFMPSDDELYIILQKHKEELKEDIQADDLTQYLKSENISLSKFLEDQLFLLDVMSPDSYKTTVISFMYRLTIARKCKELYENNFYCVNPIPKLDEE